MALKRHDTGKIDRWKRRPDKNDELQVWLNREPLWTLTEARVVIEDFRTHDNHHRLHSKLGYQSPKGFFAATTQHVPGSVPVALRASYTDDGQNNQNHITNN